MLHCLLDGGIFRWYLCYAPCSGNVVSSVGKRTYQGYFPFLLQWQDIAFVLQEHKGLGSYVAGYLTVLCCVNLALTTLGVAIAVRVDEQSQFIFSFQYSAAGNVYFFFAHFAFL